MTKTFLRRAPGRRTRTLAAVAILAGGLATTIGTASADHPEVSLPGSDFEIDTNANLIRDDPAPSIDWASVNEVRKADQPTGAQDDSFGNGAKEDTPVPSVVDGSIPPNKSDLLNFGGYLETNASSTRFLNIFWHRVQEPSGTTNMDFEFNQSSVTSSNGVTPVRTAGDVLIQYDLSQGGTNPQLFLSRWITTGAGSQCVASNSVPCWGNVAPIPPRQNLTAAGLATGSINTSAILAADSDGLGPISARTFGEAQINFTALTGGTGACSSFGSAYLKSRSSDSFTAALKDFIAPTTINLNNCASGIVRKVTDPAGSTESFGFTHNVVTTPATASPFSLSDGGSKAFNGVTLGTYVIDEASLPAGWNLIGIDCSASVGTVPVIDVAAGTVTVTLDNAADRFDCTYTNQARGTIIIEKQTDPDGSTQLFDFAASYIADVPGTPDFQLSDGQQNSTGNLVPGPYSVSEVNVPAGWEADGDPICDNGDFASAITLAAGQTVTCVFGNTQDSNIIVRKVIQGPTPGPTTFGITTSYGNFNLTAPPVNVGDDVNDSGDLAADTYSVAETGIPTNWAHVSTVCTSEDTTLEDPAAIDLTAGETVVCVVTNEWQVGAVRITKTAKHADSESGSIPLAGVVFEITDALGTTFQTNPTGADGTVCVDSFGFQTLQRIHEVAAPTGYVAGDDVLNVVIDNVAYCSDEPFVGEEVSVVNTPKTDVTVSVDSQVVGGTASVVACEDADGNPVALDNDGATGVGGDGSFTVLDLEPTDPEVTLTCTITVDP